MLALIEHRRDELRRLCAKHRVNRLELFGSAAEDRFNAADSDLDFLAEFEPMSPAELADAFFSLQEELERVLGHPVDLTELAPVRNPYFLESIDRSRVVLYDAA